VSWTSTGSSTAYHDDESAPPDVEQLFAYAEDQVSSVAATLWPGQAVELAELVPSVTCYVRRIMVGGRNLFAKYSYLGSSLPTVLGGTRRSWEEVRAAQQTYVARPGSLLARQAAQLDLLRRLGGPRTCRLAGYRQGVLFTETGPAVALTTLLAAEP
jgi:hypothetical protein